MTDAPPPSPHRPDALDALEARVLAQLRAEPGGSWDAVRAELALAQAREGLIEGPPPIDPSKSRRSTRELLVLIEALEGRSRLAPEHTRAGYSITAAASAPGSADRSAVEPAFAAALGGAEDLRAKFPDLWAIDASLWDHLGTKDARALALLWLASPGRRLVHDVGMLAEMPRDAPLGACDLSLDRIHRASGWSDAPAAGAALSAWLSGLPAHRHRWRERSASIPGAPQGAWAPYDGSVTRALRQLDQGSSVGMRGAALRWLLERAARVPFYEVDGLRRDLREELPARLASALETWLGEDAAAGIATELDTLVLQHAARITAHDDRPGATLRAWGDARWIHSCLRRSPFFGGDDKEVVAAHLRAVLRGPPARLRDGADALDPARFSANGDGLDPAGIAFLSGVDSFDKSRTEGGSELKRFIAGRPPLKRSVGEHELTITACGPADADLQDATNDLLARRQDLRDRRRPSRPAPDLNLTSSTLRLRWGQSAMLLAADLLRRTGLHGCKRPYPALRAGRRGRRVPARRGSRSAKPDRLTSGRPPAPPRTPGSRGGSLLLQS